MKSILNRKGIALHVAGAALAVSTLAGIGPAAALAQDRTRTPDAAEQMARVFGAQREAGGWLGVGIEEVTPAKAADVKLKDIHGVIVADVGQDTPAAKAGLKKGDVITEYNGQRVEGAIEFRRLVHETPAGRTAQLSVWRDGHAEKLTVQVGESPVPAGADSGFGPGAAGNFPNFPPNFNPNNRNFDRNDRNFGPDAPPNFDPRTGPRTFRGLGAPDAAGADTPRLGVTAQDLTPKLGNYFNVPDGQGVLVTDVRPGSAGEKAGMQAGDVITKLDGEQVHNLSDLRSMLRNKRDAQTVTLIVKRKGSDTSLSVQPEKPQSPSRRNRGEAKDQHIPL